MSDCSVPAAPCREGARRDGSWRLRGTGASSHRRRGCGRAPWLRPPCHQPSVTALPRPPALPSEVVFAVRALLADVS